MAKYKKAESKVVVDGKPVTKEKKHSRLNFGSKRKFIAIAGLVIVTFAIAGAIYSVFKKDNVSQTGFNIDHTQIGAAGDMTVDEVISSYQSNANNKISYGDYITLAELYFDKADADKVIENLDQASKHKQAVKDPYLYYLYGVAYSLLNEKTKAQESYTKSIQICAAYNIKNSSCADAKIALTRLK